MSGISKIQRILNKIDKANCSPDCDVQEYNEYCAELGREIYKKSLQQTEIDIRVRNPRRQYI